MHPSSRPERSCNTESARAELRTKDPTPPQGGWSAWYLTDEDDVGDSTEHKLIILLLLSVLQALAEERGWTDRLVLSDQFFGWVPTHPLVRISPDVYILENPPPAPYPKSFQTWRDGHAAPQFAVEVVSDDWQKDYDDNPPKYDQLGTRELVLFDPEAVTSPRGRRVPLQVFRRDDRGDLHCVYTGPGPVHCSELDAWLIVTPRPRLRIARDAAGTDLVKTGPENAAILAAQLREKDAQLRDQAAQLQAQADRIRELEARDRRG